MHAALDRATIVATSNNFLARIATLGETHTLDQIKVQCLRDQKILGRGFDPGQAG